MIRKWSHWRHSRRPALLSTDKRAIDTPATPRECTFAARDQRPLRSTLARRSAAITDARPVNRSLPVITTRVARRGISAPYGAWLFHMHELALEDGPMTTLVPSATAEGRRTGPAYRWGIRDVDSFAYSSLSTPVTRPTRPFPQSARRRFPAVSSNAVPCAGTLSTDDRSPPVIAPATR